MWFVRVRAALVLTALISGVGAGPAGTSVDALRVGTLGKSSFTTPRGTVVGVASAVFRRDEVSLRVLDFSHGSPRGRTMLAALHPDGIAAITGGFFNGGFRPWGLLEIDGIVEQPPTVALSGVVGSALDGTPQILSSSQVDTHALRDAIQSKPFIVDPGGRNGIHRDDAQRAVRAFVMLDGDRFALGMSSRCTLFELATAMVESPQTFGLSRVERALNLSGDRSAGFAVRLADNGIDNIAESIQVRTVLQVVPRPATQTSAQPKAP